MCKFYSAIITPTGEVLHDVHTTSHEDLVTLFNLNDEKPGRFARLEYTGEDLTDIKTYQLKVDEDERPGWLTDAMLEKAEAKLHQIVKKRIITGEVELLIGGVYITAGGAKINIAKECRIIEHRGTVQEVRDGGTVQRVMDGGTVQEVWNGGKIINDYRTKP